MKHFHQFPCDSVPVRNKVLGLGSPNKILFSQKNNQSILYSYVQHKHVLIQKIMRNSLIRSKEELKETEQIWQQREIESRKQDSFQIKKRKEIDTLVAIAIFILLFTFALLIAPNQFYNPKE